MITGYDFCLPAWVGGGVSSIASSELAGAGGTRVVGREVVPGWR